MVNVQGPRSVLKASIFCCVLALTVSFVPVGEKLASIFK